MSDFQGSVHQVVFRWDGNQGRQGTGMKAVAHSCSAERAEELGRELGPLLWVSGTEAPRQSVVRTLSLDGEVMLVQRWPTTDRGGRPSTVSHVLIGDPQALKTRLCLGLAYGGWGKPESAEKATGPQPMVECAELEAIAGQRLLAMEELLPTVKHALYKVTAEWLRDPAQRVSLLTDDEELPGWPDRDAAPLVYLGLFLLFGRWLGQKWTFATYDTVDTHQLRLMCVPRWEPDAGASGPLARLTGRPPAEIRFEHRAAAKLVDHLLTHPPDEPGVPQLVEGLRDGAALDWARRRDLLKDVLNSDRWTDAAPRRRPEPERKPEREAAREAVRETTPEPERETAYEPVRGPVHEPVHEPPAQEQAQEPAARPAHMPPPPTTAPSPPSSPPPSPAPVPEAAPPPPPPEHPAPAPRAAAPGTGHPAADPHDARALHEDLRVHQRRNATQRGLLAERLRNQSDRLLMDELRSGQLPPESVELLLDELGDEHRVRTRDTALRHELCAEVLRNGLYFTPNGQGVDPFSRPAMTRRAADLFTWAVAPLARDKTYLRDLQELLYRMGRDRGPANGGWLWQSIIAPANGQAPDLPPVLWQQILRDEINRSPAPTAPSQAPLTAPVSAPPPEPPAAAPDPPAFGSRFSALTNRPGCVVGTGFGVIAVLLVIVIVVIFR
ncbi:hypothetical protein ACIRPT_13875 [Streptomyces sp. NPDC101227]|uniref:hypothetical protein n=1 Tax=Streptomyces sp. NPDC101227 TaxID=3366136 RepID=UPI0037F3FB47